MATVEAGRYGYRVSIHISIAVLHAFILKIAFFDVMDSAGEEPSTPSRTRSRDEV